MNEGFRRKPPEMGPKNVLNGLPGLAVTAENRYIGSNLWFSYDRVLRVGPPGPALFYYLNSAGAIRGADRIRGYAAGPASGPEKTSDKQRWTDQVRPL